MEILTTFNTFKEISKTSKVFYFENIYNDGENSSTSYCVYCGINPNIYKSTISNEVDLAAFNLVKSQYTECFTEGDAIALSYNEISLRKDEDGRLMQVVEPRTGTEVIYTTHNFCDPCTWYSDSLRITETLTTSDNLIYSSTHSNWIDMISGRIQDDVGIAEEQQLLNESDPHGYQVVVKVNGVTKTMREPFESSGGDYSVNFEDGKVTFFSELLNTDVVTCSYSYATTSVFYLKPLPGKELHIEGAESDFTLDVVMSDGIEYSIYVNHPVYGKVPIKSTKYKRFSNLTQEAIGVFPVLNSMGASDADKLLSIKEFRSKSRGMKSNLQSIPFKYSTIRVLDSAYGVEVRVKTSHDRPLQGESATLTFYCTSK